MYIINCTAVVDVNIQSFVELFCWLSFSKEITLRTNKTLENTLRCMVCTLMEVSAGYGIVLLIESPKYMLLTRWLSLQLWDRGGNSHPYVFMNTSVLNFEMQCGQIET